ncbi:hypothetical protein [Nodosilinea sp. AN01ver1]
MENDTTAPGDRTMSGDRAPRPNGTAKTPMPSWAPSATSLNAPLKQD